MKISVITVTFNAESFLQDTIESVLAQDHADFEYIFVDGGSSDATLPIIQRYAAVDNRIFFSSGVDTGISQAMNKGVAAASGEVLSFLHADDFFDGKSTLSIVSRLLSGSPHAAWLTGGLRHVDEEGKTITVIQPRRFSYRRLLRGNIILHPATFIRRDAFIFAGGYTERLKYAMDYELWLRLGKISNPLICKQPLSCFRIHSGSRSCKNVDEAFDEEWLVRRDALNESMTYPLHYLYFLLKRLLNGRYIKRTVGTWDDSDRVTMFRDDNNNRSIR